MTLPSHWKQNDYQGGTDVERRNSALLVEVSMADTQNSMEVPEKKIPNATLGSIYPKEMKSPHIAQDILRAVLTAAEAQNQPRCPLVEEWKMCSTGEIRLSTA